MYQIFTTSFQGRWWVVACGCYHIVGNNLIHNFQETILTLGTTGSMVKIVKQEHKASDTLLRCLNTLASFVFIELSNFSLGDNLMSLFLLMKSPNWILQFGAL